MKANLFVRHRSGLCLLALTALMLIMLVGSAAAASFTVVTPADTAANPMTSPEQWGPNNIRVNGTVAITGTQPRSGNGSLEFGSTGSSDKADFEYYWNPADYPNRTLGNLTLSGLSFDWYRDSSSSAAQHFAPVLRLAYLTATGDSGLLIWEWVYQGSRTTADAAPTNTWVTENLADGDFWMRAFGPGRTIEAFDFTLVEWLGGASFSDSHALDANTLIYGISVGIGSGWSGTYKGFVDNVHVDFAGDSVSANFELCGTAPVTNTDTSETFCTIQAAIDDSSTVDGHTIEAAPGTYPEQVTVYKDVTLVGTGGAGSTSIVPPTTLVSNPPNPVGYNVYSLLTVNDGATAEVSGFTIDGPLPATGCGDLMTGVYVHQGASLDFHDSVVSDIYLANASTDLFGCQAGNAIRIGEYEGGTPGAATITNVEVFGFQKTGIVVSGEDSTATISDSTITGAGAEERIAQNGIQVSYGATATITGNTIQDLLCDEASCGPDGWLAAGVLLYEQTAGTTLTSNTITNTDMAVYHYSETFFTATFNLVDDNRYYGFIDDSGGSLINRNSITGNPNGGIEGSYATTEIDGTCNWWGAANGPSGEGSGDGDSASTNVDFIPWLLSAALDGDCNGGDVRLNLTAECAVGDTLYWRVTGDNDVDDVNFTWNGPGSNDGAGIVDAGERFYFTTQDAGGANTTIITWFDPKDNRNESNTKAHNNAPCVYHVTFVKVWEGADQSPVSDGTILTAESSIATATCGYTGGVWGCDYRLKSNNSVLQDLHVPFGETYSVTETGVAGWQAVEGVGSGFTGIDGFDATALPDALVYDVNDDRYCVTTTPQQFNPPLDKFCTHTVINEAQQAHLTIVKDAVPNTFIDFHFTVSGPTAIAPFALDDDRNNTLSNTSSKFEVEPGAYVVTEGQNDLYYLHDAVCRNAQGAEIGSYEVNSAAGTVSVDLAAGDDVTCTITNKLRGAIIAMKYHDKNENGQYALSEPLLGNWTINLYAADGVTLLDSETTNSVGLDKGFTSFGGLLPGNYVVCEELQAGWTNSTPLCQTVNVGSADIDIVKFGNYETPVEPGSITIIKEVETVGITSTEFFFEVRDGETVIADGIELADTQQETVSDLEPGTYTVEEVFGGFGSGFSFGGAVCVNGDEEVSIPADPSGNNTAIDVEVGEGEDWTCTFTNRARVSLSIDKVTDPAGDPTEFTFTQNFRAFDTNFVLTDASDTKNFIEGSAGTYQITEAPVDGWTLDHVTCEGVVSQTEIEGGVEIVLDWGAQADCTFYNVQDPVELCVNGGDPKADLKVSNFVYDANTGIASAKVTNNSDECTYTVGMASYQKFDNVLANQVLFDSMPDISTNPNGDGSTEIGPGEHITLRVEVPACAAQIDVFFDASHLYPLYTSSQANADQPPLVLEEFETGSFGPLGNRYGQRLLAAKHVNGTLWCDTPPGECTIGEMSVSGISEGQEVSGELDIRALFNGSNPDRVEFSLTGPWNRNWTENQSPYYFLGDSNGGQPNGWNTDNYPEGDYTIVVKSFQANRLCQEITIHFTVDRTPEYDLTIQKSSAAPGYDAQVTFNGDLPDQNGAAAGIFSVNGNDGQYTFLDLEAGTYNVSEVVPAGWDLTSVTCNQVPVTIVNDGISIDLTEGNVICVFNNTPEVTQAEPGSITIIKDRVPDLAISDFPFEIRQGATVLADPDVTETTPFTLPNLDPGTYTVEEMFGIGFGSGFVFGGAVCTDGVDEVSLPFDSNTYALDVEVGAGEDWVCTFTNYARATITITKQTVPDGDPTLFTWHQDFRPTLPESFIIGDGDTQQYVEGRAGTFTFTEDAVPGWTLTSVVCDEGIVNPLPNGFEITLDWGDSPECTVTNTFSDEPPPYEEPDPICPANYTQYNIVTHSALLTQVYNTSYSGQFWLPEDSDGFLRVWSKVGHPEAGCPLSGAPICDTSPVQDGESFNISIDGNNFFVPDHGNDQWQMFDFELSLTRNLWDIDFTHSFAATNNPWGSVNFNAVYCAAPSTENPDDLTDEPIIEEPVIEEPIVEEPGNEEQPIVQENRAPSLSLFSLFSFVGDVVDVQVVGQDEDGDTLTFSFGNLPGGLTADAAGNITGVIAAVNQVTQYTVTVTVEDGKGGSANGTFEWIIQPVYAPNPGNLTNTEGDPINLLMPDLNYPGLQLSFDYAGLPTGLTFDPTTGTVSGVAPAVDADTPFNVTLTLTVTAPGQGSATATVNFTWTILNMPEAAPLAQESAPVEQPPVEQPPVEQPSVEQPPVEQPPVESTEEAGA